MNDFEPLIFFDSNASFGVWPDKDPEERWSLGHLLEDLDVAEISAALVRHNQAVFYDAMHGNRRLIAEIEEFRDRLYPLWVALPHQAGDFPHPSELVAEMEDCGVRAVAILPKASGIPLSQELLAPLAKALAGRRILIVVPYPELGDYASADEFLEIFDASPVLVTDVSWGLWRDIAALMDAHPNLRLEFSTFQANRAIEWFVEQYGVERCLFGTGLPQKSAGAARAFLDFTLLDRARAAQVAGGNLAELLHMDLPAPARPSPWRDRITETTTHGRPVPVFVADAHCHILHDGANGGGGGIVMIKGDARGHIELARRMGVELTAVMSWNGTVGMDAAAGNIVTAGAVRQFPEEMIGLCSLNPTVQDEKEMAAEIQRYHLEEGFRGLKPYRRLPLPYNDARFERWWGFGNEHGLYVLFHEGSGGLDPIADLAKRYPHLHCLVAHSGGSYAFARRVAALAARFPNVYAELTLTPVTNGVVEWLVGEIGPGRVLFGTDAPMRDPRPQLGWVLYTRLTEDEKRLILGENFRRILRAGRLPHPLPPALQ